MDSGNSGSIQSSSGGDEEYDSSTNRPDHHHHSLLIPQDNNFLHPSLRGGGGSSSTHFVNSNLSSSSNPQLLHHPSLYDPSQSLFLAFSQPTTSSSLLNLTRSDHGSADLGNLTAANASFSGHPTLGTTSLSSDHQTTAATSSHVPSAAPQGPGPTRNPKKRTRASRRAPTTVLTTDTSNFRAMVQEFTGIPAPPFAASPYSRTRFDLFGSSSTGSTIIRSAPSHFDLMGAYNNSIGVNPLHPSPQRYPSSNSNNVNPSSATSNSGLNVIDPVSSIGYNNQLGSASDHILRQQQQQQQPQNMLNMQNQLLSFQSLINPGITHSLHPLNANKPPLASLEELGSLGHGLAGNSWRDGGRSTQEHNESQGDDHRSRPFDGSCKLTYSSSDHHQLFHHDKALEGANSVVPSRGEGTLDSWICPSD